jgi:hypothetical protein
MSAFHRTLTRPWFEDNHGQEHTPVCTFKSGKRTCHLVVEDDCYVPYLDDPDSDIGHLPSQFIFPELHTALKELPTLGNTP